MRSLVRKLKAKGVMCGFQSIFVEKCALKQFSEHVVSTFIVARNES